MRELTTLNSQREAERLAGYLVTQSIPSSVEEEDDQWVIWVVNDDDRETAQKALEAFRQNPADNRYDTALVHARTLAKQESDARKTSHRRQVNFAERWNRRWWYTHPATSVLIGISLLVSVICTDWGNFRRDGMGLPALCTHFESPILKRLFILETVRIDPSSWQVLTPFVPVLKGDFWRPVTPIFIHFGILHLLFNMIWMYQLAALVEFARGTRRYLILVFILAVTSNLGECYWSLWHARFPLFGGMSGVVFGMIGYVWIKGKTQPHEGLTLRPDTVVYSFLWLFLCMGGVVGHVANAAHLVGLIVGIVLGTQRRL